MAKTNQAGDPATFPATIEIAAVGDDQLTFWANTIVPLNNRAAYLQDQLLGATNGIVGKLASLVTSSSGARLLGVEAHTGANGQGNYLAQTAFALFGKIWDQKAGVLIDNAWTVLQTFAAGLTVPTGQTATIASGGTLSVAGSLTRTGTEVRSGTAATLAQRVSVQDPTATTATIGAMSDVYFVDGLTHSGDTVYTLQSTGTVPPVGAVVRVASINMNIGKNLDVQRVGAVSLIKFTGGADHGWADFAFLTPSGGGSAAWRLIGFGGTTTITIGTP